jgi:hypothetical protein
MDAREWLAPIIARIRQEMAEQHISAAELSRRIHPASHPSKLARAFRRGYITQCELLDIAVVLGGSPKRGRDRMLDRLLGIEEER